MIMKKITLLIVLMITSLGFSQPINNSSSPTKNAEDVVSIYGESYSNIATNYNPFWGQMGAAQVNPAYNPVTGNLVLAYPNFNYQGTELTTTNASAMEFLHVDVWTNANPANSTLQVSPINNGTGVGETLVTIDYISGSWYSVDIPKSAFTGMTWDSVFQLKFAANGPGSTVPIDIYLDNIYFWKTPVAAGTPTIVFSIPGKTLGDAPFSLTSLISSNSAGAFTYSSSNLGVATISGSTVTIVGAGTATITANQAADGIYNAASKTADLVVANAPIVAAPTPPARNATDVKSIYSNAYAPIAILGYSGDDNTYNTSWCPGVTTEIMIAGNATHKITGLGCEGVAFQSGRFDATGFTNFHMDIWTATPTMDKSFNIKFSNWNGGAGEANAIEYSGTNANFLTNPNPGTWISIDLPLADFNPINGASRNDLVQFVISSDLGTVYYDNLYLYKAPLGTEKFATSSIKMFPNPTSNTLTIEAKGIIEKVSLNNMLGQEVLVKTPKSQIATFDISHLQNGVYMVKTIIEGKMATSRVVKK